MMEEKKIPQRMCAACRKMQPKNLLLRVAFTSEGEAVVDKTGKATGRGVYVCRSEECVAAALKRKVFSRHLRREMTPENYERLKEELYAVCRGQD